MRFDMGLRQMCQNRRSQAVAYDSMGKKELVNGIQEKILFRPRRYCSVLRTGIICDFIMFHPSAEESWGTKVQIMTVVSIKQRYLATAD